MSSITLAPTSRLARAFAVLFAAGLLLVGALLVRSDEHFLSRPFIEDAFYSLSVARSLGEGGGISIDGVTPTNGVQPLICFLYAPCFAIAGDDLHLGLRLAFAVQIAIAGVTALAVAWFAVTLVRPWRDRASETLARHELFWVVAGTIAASYSLMTHLLNGLETSLAAGFVFASSAFYIERIARRPDASLAEFARLGALLGLGVLARIDVAILCVAIAAWHLVRTRRGGPPRTRPVAGAATIGVVSFLVSLPWWLYNVIVFGHLMPTSGLAQKDLLTNRFDSLDLVVRGISNSLLLFVHSPNYLDGPIAYAGLIAAAFALLAALAIAPVRRWLGRALLLATRSIDAREAIPLAAFLVVLAAYYVLAFGAPHFIPRYLFSLWLALTVGLLVLWLALWRTSCARSGRIGLALAIVAGFAASVASQTRNHSKEGIHTNVMLFPAEWIARNAEPGERIGMFQSGTTGFLDRRVTNLDGKVNARALAALRTRTLPRLVDSAAFDYIIDIDFYTRHIFDDPRLRARYVPVDTLPFSFVVWRRVDR